MKDSGKKESKVTGFYEDEIDFANLLKKIWKWKWLIIGMTTLATAITVYSSKSKPDMFTSEAGFRIGQIAGVGIEKSNNILFDLYKTELRNEIDCINTIEINKKPKKVNQKGHLPILYISSTQRIPEKAYECTKNTVNIIIEKHSKLYKSGIKMMSRNINFVKTKEILSPEFFLQTFNYPSEIVIKPEKPNKANNKRTLFKPIFALFVFFFLSVFVALIVEYINYIRNENN